MNLEKRSKIFFQFLDYRQLKEYTMVLLENLEGKIEIKTKRNDLLDFIKKMSFDITECIEVLEIFSNGEIEIEYNSRVYYIKI